VCGDRTNPKALKRYGFSIGFEPLDDRLDIMRVVSEDIKYAFKLGKPPQSSRYSDGSWNVLYTAEDHETALCEVAYHNRKHWLAEHKRKPTTRKYRLTKKIMYSLNINCSDQKIKSFSDKRLTAANDYSVTQNCARKAITSGKLSIKAPSARKKGGICYPIFDMSCVDLRIGEDTKFSLRWNIAKDELLYNSKTQIALWQI
jgi:hypothetical protein